MLASGHPLHQLSIASTATVASERQARIRGCLPGLPQAGPQLHLPDGSGEWTGTTGQPRAAIKSVGSSASRRQVCRRDRHDSRWPSNLRRRVLRRVAKEVGAPWAGFHTFRHTCASLLFARGSNAKQVQAWLGHHSAAFTLSTYIHLLDDDVGKPLALALEPPLTRPGHLSRGVRQPDIGAHSPAAS